MRAQGFGPGRRYRAISGLGGSEGEGKYHAVPALSRFQLVEISLTLAGERVQLHSCSGCDSRWWDQRRRAHRPAPGPAARRRPLTRPPSPVAGCNDMGAMQTLDADVDSLPEPAPPPPAPAPPRDAWRTGVEVAVVAACCLFVFAQLHPSLIFAATTPAGGDMGAHVWAPAYLRDNLLGKFRITGWTPDWYAGLPALTFYFPLPMLLIVLLDLVLPYGVAFKLVDGDRRMHAAGRRLRLRPAGAHRVPRARRCSRSRPSRSCSIVSTRSTAATFRPRSPASSRSRSACRVRCCSSGCLPAACRTAPVARGRQSCSPSAGCRTSCRRSSRSSAPAPCSSHTSIAPAGASAFGTRAARLASAVSLRCSGCCRSASASRTRTTWGGRRSARS